MRSITTFLTGALAVLSAAPGAFGLPATQYDVFEKIAQIPNGWVELPYEVERFREMSMRIHLTQQNVAEFEKHVIDISSPKHPSYGAHMNAHQVKMMLAPRAETVSSVVSWLEQNGFGDRLEVENDWIFFPITIAEAEELFQTTYRYYKNTDDNRVVARTLSVNLPKNLLGHVSMIQPTTMFGMKKLKSTIHSIEKVSEVNVDATVPASCGTTVTPTCLAELYSFSSYKAAGLGSVYVTGYLEQFAQHTDLNTFLAKYAPSKVGANFTFLSVDDGLDTQLGRNGDPNAVAEANLDIQYTTGLNSPVKNTFISTAGRGPLVPDLDEPASDNENEPYTELLAFLTALPDDELPNVLTTSYGESEQTIPLSVRLATCNQFAQLGARGVSVLFSSGDEGPGASCQTNDGKKTTRFLPTYPAACPFVTAVGATVGVNPEAAVSFSSGGFSDTWARPSYQDAAVTAFFNNHPEAWTQFTPFFNQSGRGFPDVAALGQNFRVILLGTDFSIGGTSASCPTVAAIVSLVNDARLQAGKPALGFLNPLFYENPSAFTDIVHGTSTGCDGSIRGSGSVPNAGWAAVSGWDASTGLGTPIFTELVNL